MSRTNIRLVPPSESLRETVLVGLRELRDEGLPWHLAIVLKAAETASDATPQTPRALEALEAGDGRAAFVLDALVATRALTTTGIV